ncbi:MAG: TRAP transporter substrate-binding protein DctP [Deltaproteobacteria bacterium]|nr:TRAP transporter substrate-binding protein DctP [Deltaproteobacteria bacterium]
MRRALGGTVVLLTLGLFVATAAPAADLVLKGATAWKKHNDFNNGFWQFQKEVVKRSGGKMRVDWKGGPEISSPFEMLGLVQRGVLDILNGAGAYDSAKIPEGVFLEYFVGKTAELRAAGVTKFFDGIVQKRAGVKFLGLTSGPVGFAIFTKKPVSSINDFKGKKMRSTPTYLPLGQALGATMIQVPWPEVYNALERGVVDGYFSPVIGTLGNKLYEQVCCMLKPYFWTVRTWLYMSLDSWNKLAPDQQKVITDSIVAVEKWTPGYFQKLIDNELDALVNKHGMKVTELKGDEAKRFRTMAYESSWKKYLPNSPEYGKQIRELARGLEDR